MTDQKKMFAFYVSWPGADGSNHIDDRALSPAEAVDFVIHLMLFKHPDRNEVHFTGDEVTVSYLRKDGRINAPTRFRIAHLRTIGEEKFREHVLNMLSF